ncbi:MAG TPA: hypothetical protein VN420_04240 [Candidatus Fimivivens sp.]|nr:hypothetical protein [Candidatus Fimivivens sp.]
MKRIRIASSLQIVEKTLETRYGNRFTFGHANVGDFKIDDAGGEEAIRALTFERARMVSEMNDPDTPVLAISIIPEIDGRLLLGRPSEAEMFEYSEKDMRIIVCGAYRIGSMKGSTIEVVKAKTRRFTAEDVSAFVDDEGFGNGRRFNIFSVKLFEMLPESDIDHVRREVGHSILKTVTPALRTYDQRAVAVTA